ncbi:MAG: endonuclease dU [Promethearchaeota archaeon]
MILTIKDGIHVVAIDDAPHIRGDMDTEVFFTYCKSTFIEKVTHATITVDGTDSTRVILEELAKNSESFTLIVLHGITVGGLNIVDIQTISEKLHKPIIAVTENPPTQNLLYNVVEFTNNSQFRKKLLKKAGSLQPYLTKHGSTPIYYHMKDISEKVAEQFFEKFCIRSRLPEQLLITHKIASAWKK